MAAARGFGDICHHSAKSPRPFLQAALSGGGGPGGVAVAAGGEQREVEDVSEMLAGTGVLPE